MEAAGNLDCAKDTFAAGLICVIESSAHWRPPAGLAMLKITERSCAVVIVAVQVRRGM